MEFIVACDLILSLTCFQPKDDGVPTGTGGGSSRLERTVRFSPKDEGVPEGTSDGNRFS